MCTFGAELWLRHRYAEKQVGYMACAILLNEVNSEAALFANYPSRTLHSATKLKTHLLLQKDEFLRLIINSIRNDLISRNEAFQCLALGFVGNGEG